MPAVGTTCLIVLCNVPVETGYVDHATTTSKRGKFDRLHSIILIVCRYFGSLSVVSILMSMVKLRKRYVPLVMHALWAGTVGLQPIIMLNT